MAYVTQSHSSTLSSVWGMISDVFASIGRSIAISSAMEARMNRVSALNEKTDAELAAMNLRRQDITAYVFRDLMHL